MNKIDTEQYILEIVKPKLKKIYGYFNVIPEQSDNPDAAIELESSKKHKIGIEITTVDKQKNLQYLNDEKITQSIQLEQLKDLGNNQTYNKKPMKKVSIDFPKEYIFENIVKKEKKYLQYKKNDNYHEIVLVVFSSFLQVDKECFKFVHKPWSEFFLSKKKFPFDKVIFVDIKTKKTVHLYNKNSPLLVQPEFYDCVKSGITVVKSSILPFGKEVNVKDMFKEEPLIPAKKNKKYKKLVEPINYSAGTF